MGNETLEELTAKALECANRGIPDAAFKAAGGLIADRNHFIIDLCAATADLRARLQEAVETVSRCWEALGISATQARQPLWGYLDDYMQAAVDAEGAAQRAHDECEQLRTALSVALAELHADVEKELREILDAT